MARTFVYSPWRRTLLQAVLCAVLVGTLGLASAVSKYKLRASQVKLTPPVQINDIAVPLPEKWALQAPHQTVRGALIIQATEPAADNDPTQKLFARTLTVVRDHTDIPQPPAEYLLTSTLMPPAYAVTLGGVGKVTEVSATPVAGQQGGYLLAGLRAVRLATGQILLRKEVFATVMLPSRDTITVKLEGVGEDPTADVALVRRIAAGIVPPPAPAAAKQPTTAPADAVPLADGSTVKVPPDFAPLPEPDPHVTERHLVHNTPPARWSRVTLVPCVFFPGTDDQETFRTMLAARDGEWVHATIAASPSAYRADLPLPGGLPFPRRAYLLTSPTGHALMVELQAGSQADADDWNALIDRLTHTVTSPTSPRPADLLKAGANDVARLKETGLPSLLAGVPTDQWWVWTLGAHPLGWSHLTFDPAASPMPHGTAETRFAGANGGAATIQYAFETSADLARHNDQTVRRDVAPGREPFDRGRAQSSLLGNRFQLSLTVDPLTGKSARFTRPAPPAFIPGPWLPLLAAKLPTDHEFVVRTSRVPGLEAIEPTSYLNVRVRPTTRPSTFDLDVSGTGQVITVSPTAIDVSTTNLARPATPAQVKKIFATDPAMLP